MITPDIEGADAVVQWFGEWPCFHDSEILQLLINRGGTSELRIDLTGYSASKSRAILVFEFSGITSLRIHGEDADVQNVMSGLDIEKGQSAYRIGWDSLYGMAGEIEVEILRVRLEPYTGDAG
jgi:hypothetical protein